MSTSSKDEHYLHFRAPRQHGEVLCVPSPESFASGIARNSEALYGSEVAIYGVTLGSLRHMARQELSQKLNVSPHKPWIAGGHQPELFHPGVWLKNFVLDRFAQVHNAVALNFVVDHDLCNQVSIRVPTLTKTNKLELESVSWDSHSQGVPWERHRVQEMGLFENFAARICTLLEPLGMTPVIESLWDQAFRLNSDQCSIGEIFAAIRRSVERKFGFQSTEFFSRDLVQTQAFGLLLLHLIEKCSEFQRIHNTALQHYRLAHRIRSTAHPVTDLKRTSSEFEIPLWVHTTHNARRRAVFVGRDKDSRYLTDQTDILLRWSTHDSDEHILSALAGLEKMGVFLRPRALLTTMLLRLLISDWFIHGIGGGKYDQLNDRIMGEFFGITPPRFSVISGTLFLPILPNPVTPSLNPVDTQKTAATNLLANDACGQSYLDWQHARTAWIQARQLERDQQYHPEKYLTHPSAIQQKLIDQQFNLRSEIPQRGSKRSWHRELEIVRQQLAKTVCSDREDYAVRVESAWQQMQQAQIRISREFSFAIFPENWLIPRLQAQAERCCPAKQNTTVHTSPQTSAT